MVSEDLFAWLEASKKKFQITDKFLDGTILGIKEGSEEFIVGTLAGCVVCRTVRRRPREDAADPVFQMTSRENPAEELAANVTKPEMLPISFATSVLRGLRRTLEDVTGAIGNSEAGPTVEEECLVQKLARESGRLSYDEVTQLPLEPKMVADAIRDELTFMRKLQVYHEVPLSYLDWSGCSHRDTMGLHEQG